MPWSAIVQSQDDFVARKYLPEDVDLKEPSKLQNWDTTALLNVWYAWQDTGEGPTFEFKAWKNKDGDMVASIVSGTLTSQQTRKVKKWQRVMIRRPQDSSTEMRVTLISPKMMLMMTLLMVYRHKRDPEEYQVLHQHEKIQQSHVQFQSLAWQSQRKLVPC
jgi:hypothetical protein